MGLTNGHYLLVEDDGGSEVDRHERRLSHEEVVQPNHVRIVGQHVAEPLEQKQVWGRDQ